MTGRNLASGHSGATSPALSVVIPWSDRKEFAITLGHNKTWLTSLNAEMIVVNMRGDGHQLKSILATVGAAPVVGVDAPSKIFNRSFALNIGIHLSRAPYILALDADVVATEASVRAMMNTLTPDAFVTLQWLHENVPGGSPLCASLAAVDHAHLGVVSEAYLSLSGLSSEPFCIRTYKENAATASRAGGGMLLATKEHLLGVNGYNSRLEAWGFEDHDITIRLRLASQLTHLEAGEMLHLTHGDDIRDIGGINKNKSHRRNLAVALNNYARGSLSGSLTEDLSAWNAAGDHPSSLVHSLGVPAC